MRTRAMRPNLWKTSRRFIQAAFFWYNGCK
jgi:hypothetical protein